jgi:hypothetical protein
MQMNYLNLPDMFFGTDKLLEAGTKPFLLAMAA